LHWALRACSSSTTRSGLVACAVAAASMGAALGVKWTLLPAAMMLMFPILHIDWRRRLAVVSAIFLAAVAFGSGPNLIRNILVDRHPFGSHAFRAGHQPDPGWHPIVLNLRRLPF